ncbi:MAG: TatD family hydrolase [Bacteroidaceae bacterium]|nr:TatD family hydrolase [Bacteroidaceae bacterium]
MIIDTHCHFDMMSQPEAYIRQKEQAGDIVIGMTNLPSHFEMGLPHVKRYKHIRLALGLHPLLASENKNELPLFDSLLDQTSYIGEIGLDFSKEGLSTKDDQVFVLRKLLEKLKGKKKIISVHSRKAENELFDLLCVYNIQNVIFHWYTGPIDLIPSIISKGYYFSINEAMTISNKGRAIIKVIPRNRIITESDAPFNNKTDIKEAQINMHITKNEVKNNFMELLSRIK